MRVHGACSLQWGCACAMCKAPLLYACANRKAPLLMCRCKVAKGLQVSFCKVCKVILRPMGRSDFYRCSNLET